MSARILKLRTEHQPLNASDPGADPDPENATAEKPKKMTVLDLGNGSEVLHMPRFISYQDSWRYFDYLNENIPWTRPTIRVFARSHVQPRDICYIASEGLTQLGYSGFRPHAYSWDEFPPLKDILDLVHRVLPGSSFNSLLLNRYKGGSDYVGWHADDEKLYGSTPVIASVSFGCERDFILKKKPSKVNSAIGNEDEPPRKRSKKANSSDQHVFLLNHGSLLVMRGHTQRDWLHSVPKRVKAESVRINLTFRRILF
ncbi:Alpha-ketoglutarate-dependent dioxygenase alkB 2 [Orobanche minor]